MELIQKWTNGDFTVTLDMRELQRLVDKEPERAERIVGKVAKQAEGYMKVRVPDRVDTGAMMSSIYSVTDKHDGFSEAAGAARSQNPDAIITPHPQPPPMTAYVGPCVEYAVYNEFGTYRMAAHPFVVPGAERAIPDLERLAPELFE